MRTVPLIQFGVGLVGRALMQMVAATTVEQARLGMKLRYIAIVDRESAIIDDHGLPEQVLESALRLKARGGSLSTHEWGAPALDLAAIVDVAGQEDAVVIDTTAAEADVMLPALLKARQLGYGVVLANKKPLTADLASFQALTSGGARPARYEATVGAGLPVISTLRLLLDTGDEVRAIHGALSGTLGYLMSELQQGISFGDAVRQAKALGYTEPDPRDDLSGRDVARKALILGRTIGLPLEMHDVTVEALYPDALAGVPLNDFMANLNLLDMSMNDRVGAAAADGRVLRYAAEVAASGMRVGLRAEPTSSALGALQGPDNLVAFHTRRYERSPLVVQGAGAGAEVTASAILHDVQRLMLVS